MLLVKLLAEGARAPEVAHPGEDLGYDVFALEAVELWARSSVRVKTGIAVEARHPETGVGLGLLVRDRSSMAARGVAVTGGVQRGVITKTMLLALVGIVLGTVASLLLSREVASQLFGTQPNDPETFVGMILLLGAVALVAGYVPARRASRIDPMIALRNN